MRVRARGTARSRVRAELLKVKDIDVLSLVMCAHALNNLNC